MFAKIKKLINQQLRKKINAENRQRLKNRDFSVLSANCTGAFILHDLGQKFNSPFVNLYLAPPDFVKYLQRIEHYMQADLEFIPTEKNYPVAKLDDLTIHFMHYHSEQEAREKWLERTKRINLANLFVIISELGACDEQTLRDFDALPFKNKVAFTQNAYPELQSTFQIQGFKGQKQLGDLFAFSGWNGHKYYDQFDYVSWFNGQLK